MNPLFMPFMSLMSPPNIADRILQETEAGAALLARRTEINLRRDAVVEEERRANEKLRDACDKVAIAVCKRDRLQFSSSQCSYNESKPDKFEIIVFCETRVSFTLKPTKAIVALYKAREKKRELQSKIRSEDEEANSDILKAMRPVSRAMSSAIDNIMANIILDELSGSMDELNMKVLKAIEKPSKADK